MSKLPVILGLVFGNLIALGQDVTFVSEFELVEVEAGVFVNWKIDSGYTCQGVDVLRSLDAINFEEVDHISGVCGSLTKSVRYSFLDESPDPNTVNYYRLKLNGYGFSEILDVYYIELPEFGVVTYPNPVEKGGDFILRFDNINKESVIIQFIDVKGMVKTEIATNESQIKLSTRDLPKGIYNVRIIGSQESELRLTKIVVN